MKNLIRKIQNECMEAHTWDDVDLVVERHHKTLETEYDAREAVRKAYRRIYRVRKSAMENTELIYKN